MSLAPTSSSIMQPYGQPCALSTERQVMAKSARKAAPTALEVNSEGVIQLDGVSTRGMLMSGGPVVECRNLVVVPVNTTLYTATAAEFVNGTFLFCESTGPVTLVLPSVAELNKFVNSNLATTSPSFDVNVGASNVRTMFRVTVICNSQLATRTNAAAQPGYNQSGFYMSSYGGVDFSVSGAVAPGGNTAMINAALIGSMRCAYDLWFIQFTTGPAGLPEWLCIGAI